VVYYYSVGEPVSEVSPDDGELTVLPRSVWRQQLALDYDNPHADDFLFWEQEHYAQGPRRTAQGRYGSAVADCPDCITRQGGSNSYCELHRCRGINANGQRCKQPAAEVSGLVYCRSHGCQEQLGPRGVRCPEPAGIGGYCAGHHNIPVPH
jgi:hypothetical protein